MRKCFFESFGDGGSAIASCGSAAPVAAGAATGATR
jgi:hypothetical protein